MQRVSASMLSSLLDGMPEETMRFGSQLEPWQHTWGDAFFHLLSSTNKYTCTASKYTCTGHEGKLFPLA
jgi:hypothetical protein